MHKLRKIKLIIVIVFFLIVSYFLTKTALVEDYLLNPQALRDVLLGFGLWAHLVIVLLIIFQTMISIIPSDILFVVAGFTFGPFLGLIYGMIGSFIGSAFVFLISRRYGKQLALKFFEKKDLVHFNLFFKKRKLQALFLARAAPLFPNDTVSFAAGLTDINFKNFNLVSSSAYLVKMLILGFFGAKLATGKLSIGLIITLILVGILMMILLFRRKIRKILIKEIYQLEKEGKIIEKEIEKEFRKI